MNLKHVLAILITTFMLSFGLPKNIQKKVDAVIKSTFNIEHFELSAMLFSQEITNTLPATFGIDNLFKIEDTNILIGYAYIGKAQSKTDEFDYLILLDKDLVIVKSKVLIYREDYGGEIGSKRWLKQFIGKSYNDRLMYGDNIAAISGATISVQSMTAAINNVLASIKILHEKTLL